ncbi:protein LITTLE ZIPPER 2-like [Rhodamnia argentea]|uniref:Protein LITTLE ZIPPER 2-like n=1 Tax=Rhodamnia argentea TaxID=178133 RepID=A0A8B8PKW8_9MYRT|nr:protein LITTLE ZIPPER 2-like [Rhodamnia argentea]
MCTNSSKWSLRRRQLKQRNLRLLSLSRKRRTRRSSKGGEDKETKRWLVGAKEEMEMKNLRLYMENRSIMEANERLRQRALFLHRENRALLFQLQSKFPRQTS